MNYFPPDVDDNDRALLQRAGSLLRNEFSDGLTRADLRRINARRGVDFATALLYSHFMSKLRDDWFQAVTVVAPKGDASLNTPPSTIAIAPGAFYKEYPSIGADGRELVEAAESRNWNCELIPTASLGTLDQNAATITQWFDAREASDIVLLSLSKGAADVKIALESRPDLWDRISAWICVSGVLYGTKITNWLLERKRLWLTTKFVLWYRNLERESLIELRHNSDTRGRCEKTGSRLDFSSARIQRNPICDDSSLHDPIHIVGFPLVKHLSCWRARLWHRRFRGDGPNDGVMLLDDFLEQPGTVLPIWGADHYMKSSFDTSKLLARIIDLVATRGSKASDTQSKVKV